jgi:hypothetical protein
MTLRKFALIGNRDDIDPEYRKLTQDGVKSENIYFFTEPEKTCTKELIKKVLELEVTTLICIQTRNGQTSYWAFEFEKLKKAPKPHHVDIFGIRIPKHPHGINPRSLSLVKMINCSKEVLKMTA